MGQKDERRRCADKKTFINQQVGNQQTILPNALLHITYNCIQQYYL